VLSGHPINVRLPERLPDAVMDAAWIKKVLQHVLENAAKYSPPGSPIFVSSEVKNDRLITSVADRGAGIDDLERSMIFDKFYRGQGQRHLEVTSQLGHGSVFSFGLPIASSFGGER
jgi:two-component system sensor histidine kinase KdpD